MAPPPEAARFPVTDEARGIGQAIQAVGGRPVLVGGWVRDCLLGMPHSKDFDIEVFRLDPERLRRALGRFGHVHAVGRHFGVLKLTTPRAEYDVSVPRRESKTGKGHKGFWVTPDPAMTFEQAAYRRDFTINSMGYAFLEEEFLDPYGGREDLRSRLLRHVGPAFGEDPLRVLRAMQFAGRFALTIVPETLAICREQDLVELARERVWDEFKKLLLHAPQPSLGLAYAPELGVLRIFPELAALHGLPGPAPGAWARTLAVLDQAAALLTARDPGQRDAADLALMLAALCHELGHTTAGHGAGTLDERLALAALAPAEELLARLTNEQDLVRRALALVRELPVALAAYTQRERSQDATLRRLAVRCTVAELARLVAARERAQAAWEAGAAVHTPAVRQPPAAAPGSPAADWLREQAARLGVLHAPPAPLLLGRHLLELGAASGPRMGQLLQQAYELQLQGQLATVEDALAWASGVLKGREHAP